MSAVHLTPKFIVDTKSTLFKKGRELLPTVVRDLIGTFFYRPRCLWKYGTTDFFKCVEIETITTCNRRCSYCPNSKFERGLYKNQKLMDEKLFKKIIDDLAALGFWGRISPHFYGEPLLDTRITDFVKYTRQKLPYANIVIYTNGDFLTVELFDELVKNGVDLFVVTQHGKTMLDNMKILLGKKETAARIHYIKFTPDTPLSNRGGLIEFPPTQKVLHLSRCFSPSDYLTIDYAGNCILCCNDYFSTVKFGNLEAESVKTIWEKGSFKRIRAELRKGIFRLDICKRCTGLK